VPRVVWLVHWIFNHYLDTLHARSNAKLSMYTAWRHKRWRGTAPIARTSKTEGDVWSAAPPVEGNPCTHWIGGWVGSQKRPGRSGDKKKSLVPTGIESHRATTISRLYIQVMYQMEILCVEPGASKCCIYIPSLCLKSRYSLCRPTY
jgi:hypothetical protein